MKGINCKPFTRISIIILVAMNAIYCESPESNQAQDCEACITLLKEATRTAPTIFIKVHAAEALIGNNRPEGLKETFADLQKVPENFLASTRVLARLDKDNPAKFSEHIERIVDKFLHGDSSRMRLIALESLGKLGYQTSLPEIEALSQSGENGFKAMARWVLANSGDPKHEARLGELLLSKEVTEYRTAAYALRFFSKIRPGTYEMLRRGSEQLTKDAPGRVYVLSSLFVHTASGKHSQIKSELLTYTKGETAERYETAEGLSLAGDTTNIPLLETLLKDPDMDVRVAAANAMLRIQHRSKNR